MKTQSKSVKLALLGLFTAVIILMAFTPLGYLRTLGLEITFIVIPVSVGAVLLGPAAGAFLGGVFGVSSLIQCFGFSPFGAALLSIDALATVFTCIVPRVLVGFLTGLIFKGLSRTRVNRTLSIVISNLCCPLINTLLFMSCVVLFFYGTDYIQEFVTSLGAANPFMFVLLFVGINGAVEAGVCFVAGSAVSKALDVVFRKTRTPAAQE